MLFPQLNLKTLGAAKESSVSFSSPLPAKPRQQPVFKDKLPSLALLMGGLRFSFKGRKDLQSPTPARTQPWESAGWGRGPPWVWGSSVRWTLATCCPLEARETSFGSRGGWQDRHSSEHSFPGELDHNSWVGRIRHSLPPLLRLTQDVSTVPLPEAWAG